MIIIFLGDAVALEHLVAFLMLRQASCCFVVMCYLFFGSDFSIRVEAGLPVQSHGFHIVPTPDFSHLVTLTQSIFYFCLQPH